jgi:hypothetical protein
LEGEGAKFFLPIWILYKNKLLNDEVLLNIKLSRGRIFSQAGNELGTNSSMFFPYTLCLAGNVLAPKMTKNSASRPRGRRGSIRPAEAYFFA